MERELERKCIYDSEYVEVERRHDANYGEYRLRKNKLRGDLVLVKDLQATSKNQALTMVASLATRMELRHPNLMALKDFSCKEDRQLCSTLYSIHSFYEYYDSNMIKMKQLVRDPAVEHSEWFMTKLMYDMVDGVDI